MYIANGGHTILTSQIEVIYKKWVKLFESETLVSTLSEYDIEIEQWGKECVKNYYRQALEAIIIILDQELGNQNHWSNWTHFVFFIAHTSQGIEHSRTTKGYATVLTDGKTQVVLILRHMSKENS